MIDLVTLVQGKLHLNILDSNHDADIAMKISQASELVMNHYKAESVPDDWVVSAVSPISYSIPKWAEASTLLVLSELFEKRESSEVNVLSDAVKSLIPRVPTLV